MSLSRPICSGGHNNTDELCVWRAELMDFPAKGKRKRSFGTALLRNLPFIMMLILLIVDKVATVKVRLCLTYHGSDVRRIRSRFRLFPLVDEVFAIGSQSPLTGWVRLDGGEEMFAPSTQNHLLSVLRRSKRKKNIAK